MFHTQLHPTTVAILDILKMGDPRLLRVAEPVSSFDTPELHALLRDMRDTMAAAVGAGLAAPQIGVNLQVVIFGTGQPMHATRTRPWFHLRC